MPTDLTEAKAPTPNRARIERWAVANGIAGIAGAPVRKRSVRDPLRAYTCVHGRTLCPHGQHTGACAHCTHTQAHTRTH